MVLKTQETRKSTRIGKSASYDFYFHPALNASSDIALHNQEPDNQTSPDPDKSAHYTMLIVTTNSNAYRF